MKQRKTGLWRTLTVVFVLLAAFTVAGSSVAGTYAALINATLGIESSRIVKADSGKNEDTQYFKSAYSSLEEEYQTKAALIRQIGREGTILLKNENGALPMASGTVMVLGGSSFMCALAHGGGSMNAADLANATTVEQALAFNGLKVITEGDSADAALVVIGRSAGEGADMPEGGLALTEEELSMVTRAKAVSGKVIVLLSGDFYPECASLQKDPEISAILHLGNAGYRGAYGLADVFTGKASPSGRTVETVAVDSHSSAAMQNYGDHTYTNASKIMASQAKTYVVYAEGIYKDYKYYETRYEDCVLNRGNASFGGWAWEEDVLYPFGYGLSYTTFSKELQSVTFDSATHTAAVQVKVTNTGSAAGKEVVQVYGQSPYTDYDKANLIEKAAVQLMGFEKTAELAPGASETVTVILPMQWLASFDTKGHGTYIMEEGTYYLSVGANAHDAVNNILSAKGASVDGKAALTYTWNQAETDATTYAKSLYTGEEIKARFPDADINYWLDETDQILYLSRNDWQGTWPRTVQLTASDKLKSALNDKKKYENGVYNDTASRIQTYEVKTGDGSTILSAAMMRGRAFEDEYWKVLLDNMT
ncbi:MAG: glycoside hydrolase family 3 C-terminal domain-containing protein, partial [Oscillospiraceae bacterium]|nr:glycoside hydrolase family 3 C-terminal domain-containing protein [Oscillospiraceae bacterium]